MQPQVQGFVVVAWQGLIEGGGEAALDVVFALHDADLFQHLGKPGLEQVGALLFDALGRGFEFGLLGAEFLVPGAGLDGLQAVFQAVGSGQRHDQAVVVLQLVQQLRQLFAQVT